MQNLLQTDTYSESTVALEMLAEQAGRIEADFHRWKWVILALHNAIQTFMTLALRGSSNQNVLHPKSLEAWNDAPNAQSIRAEILSSGRVNVFLGLYKDIKSDKMLHFVGSRKFVPHGTQGKSIKQLNMYRNTFVHYLPTTWILEVSGLPDICLDCLDIVQFLGWESGNIYGWDESIEQRAHQALQQSCASFRYLKTYYNS